MSVAYQDNGVLPYSSYFYKKFMGQDFYTTALSMNLSLFLLKPQNDNWLEQKGNNFQSIRQYITKIYIKNYHLTPTKFSIKDD